MTETNAERLERLKDVVIKFSEPRISAKDVLFLLEQAERAQELGKGFSSDADSKRKKVLELNADDFERIIHALKFRRERSLSKSHKCHMDRFIEKVEFINGKR